MKGWATKTIGDVCTIVNGGTPKTNVPAYWDGGHLWITPAEMGKRESPYAGDTARKLTDKGLEDCSAKMLPPLSVILSSRAPIGHLVINTAPMATNQGCKGLIPGKELDHKFLFYYLGSIVDHLNDLGTGATFKELSGGKLKEVAIPLPPLDEQRRIVAVLDEAFAGLAVMRANAEANLANARALFDSHLNAIFSQKGEGWVERPIVKLATKIGSGGTPRGGQESYKASGTPLIRSMNVHDRRFKFDDLAFLDDEQAEKLNNVIVQKDDVLLNITGASVARCCRVPKELTGSRVNQHVSIIRPIQSEILPRFLEVALTAKANKKRLLGVGEKGGSTRQAITKAEIEDFRLAYPPLVSQSAIVELVDDLELETTRLETLYRQKLAAIDELKQSLLQKAFAGELNSDRAILSPALS